MNITPNADPNLVAVFRAVDGDGFTRLADLPIRGWDEYGTALVALRSGSLVPITTRLGGGWRFLRVTGWATHVDSFNEDGEHYFRHSAEGTYTTHLPADETRAVERKLRSLNADHPIEQADR